MIQDIAPHQFQTVYEATPQQDDDLIFLFYHNMLYLRDDHSFLTRKDLEAVIPENRLQDALYFLFRMDQISCYLIKDAAALFDSSRQSCLLPSAVPVRLSDVRRLSSDPAFAFTAYTAAHLAGWYEGNRFCGHCGSPMIDGTDERKRVCPTCKAEVYPRINPAVIAAVHDGDRLLMTKYAGRSVTWFVLVAGFTEIGESAEETVRREVLEETGIHVKNIRYFGSQPWGIPGNLTLGYTAELDGSDEITLDTAELSEGAWIRREDVPQPNDSLSITSAMIRAFKEGKF